MNIAISIIDVNTIDIVIATINIIVLIFLLLFFYHKKLKNQLINTVKLFIITTFICMFYRLKYTEIIAVNIVLTLFLYGTIIILKIFISGWPQQLIEKIFQKDNNILKVTVIFTQISQFIAIAAIIAMLFANIYVSLPISRLLVNGKYVLYSGNEQYLICEYEIIEDKIKFDFNTLELISKENVTLSNTDRIAFIGSSRTV